MTIDNRSFCLDGGSDNHSAHGNCRTPDPVQERGRVGTFLLIYSFFLNFSTLFFTCSISPSMCMHVYMYVCMYVVYVCMQCISVSVPMYCTATLSEAVTRAPFYGEGSCKPPPSPSCIPPSVTAPPPDPRPTDGHRLVTPRLPRRLTLGVCPRGGGLAGKPPARKPNNTTLA